MASEPELDALLQHLKHTRGFDFTGYKRASLERRISKRMAAVGAATYQDYLNRLEVDPAEFAHLFDTILINVTSFFRDTQAWEHLANDIVPPLLEAIGPDAPVRVWCAGCASGQEPYTLAMVLADALGDEAYVERVKIYATDIDEDALNTARHGVYTGKQVEGVPPEYLERFFLEGEARFAFRPELRRSMIFGRNDLLQDAPISRIDLLTCRNTLMYFNAEAQGRILRRFHFALNPHGALFLGKSEMLITHTDLFRPINLQRRIFQKVPAHGIGEQVRHAVAVMDGNAAPAAAALHERAFEALPTAQVVIDAAGVMAAANQRARKLFRLAGADVGRPLKDLELSYRPVDLRSSLEEAFAERRTIVLGPVPASADGEQRELEVHLTPVFDGQEHAGATIAFLDVTLQRRLDAELRRSAAELEQAHEELQSTVEELETTNEELQSTNEELETTNEELQSTNEELETMNEELQSTNEELETINDELRSRTSELDEVNAFLESILTVIGAAVAVVDQGLRVRVWNSHAVELWGLRPEEVQGEPLLGLDIGLPVDKLKLPLRQVLKADERQEVELDATNRRGRPVRIRVSAMPLVLDGAQARGAVVVMEVVSAAG
ncbi:MAG TPA: CheR family methyltransferase [Solirubrobacteraceae bacterium]|nr:CheR family methyltransferase [Solirubrobacteraceae bacterium]